MAQFVERLLPTSEIRGSNPNISKISSTNCTIEKTNIKKRRRGMAHLLENCDLSNGIAKTENTDDHFFRRLLFGF